jgi:diacylglycerol kinase (ATP)
MTKHGPIRKALSLARQTKRLARLAADVEHVEESAARELVRAQAEARIQALIAASTTQPTEAGRAPLPALLIVNSKSGPAHDSLLRVREIVDLLAGHGIAAEVRVKLHKSQARRDARAAAKRGYPLVIAAGGDGTVASVARGLIGSNAVLGIIRLGTYNNVATSLGIPADVVQACALIAAAPVRAVDVGQVRAKGMNRPRAFLEIGAVGIAAPLTVAGQGFEKGRWDAIARHLPDALAMSPTVLGVRIDGRRPAYRAQSLLALVANTPRFGAGLRVAPDARVDDGLLEVRVYEDMTQLSLAAHIAAVKAGTVGDEPRVRSTNARKVEIKSATPLPVVVDSKVVGSTPAHFRTLTGALLVIAGRGDGLSRPAAQPLVSAIKNQAVAPPAQGIASQNADVRLASLPTRSPGAQLAKQTGPVGLALAAAAAVTLTPALARWIGHRRR